MKLTRRSLTLIELLLVLMILAALAASAASFVEESDDQFRYQDTQNRLTSIREGILGDAGGGRARHAGFAADLGRLPLATRELLELPALAAPPVQGQTLEWSIDDGSAGLLASLRGADKATGLGFGWRGPYLSSLPNIAGDVLYADGWGNGVGDATNFGWEWRGEVEDASGDPRDQDLVVRSLGRGGLADGSPPPSPTDYARDYPATPLIVSEDYAVLLTGQAFSVHVVNNDTSQRTLRLRVRYFGFKDASDRPTFLGTAPAQVSLFSDSIDFEATADRTQSFAFKLSGDRHYLPLGRVAFDLVDDGTQEVSVAPGSYTTLGPIQLVEVRPRAGISLPSFTVTLE